MLFYSVELLLHLGLKIPSRYSGGSIFAPPSDIEINKLQRFQLKSIESTVGTERTGLSAVFLLRTSSDWQTLCSVLDNCCPMHTVSRLGGREVWGEGRFGNRCSQHLKL